ncbi:MAG: CBS domain-containing protein [Acidimicrobiia bacterium]|nr:CBS domain-containing protein [Acidimicrobiia bacterium]
MYAIREVLEAKAHDVHAAQGSDTLAQLIEQFGNVTTRCLAVTEGDALIGVVTVRDALTYIGRHGEGALAVKVEAVMTRDVTTITPDTRLGAAAALFAENSFHHLPVVENGELVGMVTPADVLTGHLAHVQNETTYLRDYVAGVYY